MAWLHCIKTYVAQLTSKTKSCNRKVAQRVLFKGNSDNKRYHYC